MTTFVLCVSLAAGLAFAWKMRRRPAGRCYSCGRPAHPAFTVGTSPTCAACFYALAEREHLTEEGR